MNCRHDAQIRLSIDHSSLKLENIGQQFVWCNLKILVDKENPIRLADVPKNKHLFINERMHDDLVSNEVVELSFIREHKDISFYPLPIHDVFFELADASERPVNALLWDVGGSDEPLSLSFIVLHQVKLWFELQNEEGAALRPVHVFGNSLYSSYDAESVPVVERNMIRTSHSNELASE